MDKDVKTKLRKKEAKSENYYYLTIILNSFIQV